MPRIFAALLALLIAGPAAADLMRGSVSHEGGTRSYAFVRPAPSDAPRPLILVLHGAGQTAEDIEAMTGESWSRIARTEGWLVAYPEAQDRIWDMAGGRISEGMPRRTDDAAYLGAVIDDIARRYKLDETRIFVTGFSRGAQATFLAACKLPGRIRAVAPVAMVMPAHLAESCRKGPPVGIFTITGTADPFVPHETGPVIFNGQERDTMLSPEATAAHWRARNGCASSPEITDSVDNFPDDGTILHRTIWPACTPGITNIRIENGGHAWPSAARTSLFRTPNREIDATAAAFAFFRSFQ